MASGNPFKQVLDIRRDEWAGALLMFSYFFLVITTFWILKPLKKSLFIGHYVADGIDILGSHFSAPQAEMIAKIGNMFVAFFAAALFAYLSRYLRREKLTYAFTGLIIAIYLVFRITLLEPHGAAVWSFYIFGDIYNTLMLAAFFAFLNDSTSPAQGKRLYGLIVLGGVAGGAVGSSFVAAAVGDLSLTTWLTICTGIALVIAVLAGFAARSLKLPEEVPNAVKEPPLVGNAATEGARLVFGSRYLLSIVAIVGLYEMVSTIMDFQFTSAVVHYVDGPDLGEYFSRVFAFTNMFGLVVQLLFASFILTRFGQTVALLVMPIAALTGSVGFMIVPGLLVGSSLNTLDNGFNYSINQSAKELLYTATSRVEKYSAKAFIDMFVQRFAKAVAVGLSLAITTFFTGFESVRWLSILTATILLAWIFIARYAGRTFDELTDER